MARYAPHPRSPLSNGYSTDGRVRPRPSRTALHATRLATTRLGFRQRGIGQAPPGTTVDNIAALLERGTLDQIRWRVHSSALGYPGWAQEIIRVRDYISGKLSWLRAYVASVPNAYGKDAFLTALNTMYDMAKWQKDVTLADPLQAGLEWDWEVDLGAYIKLHSQQMGWVDSFINEVRAERPALSPEPGPEQEVAGADGAGGRTTTYVGLAVAGYGAYTKSPAAIISGVLVMALGGVAERFGV